MLRGHVVLGMNFGVVKEIFNLDKFILNKHRIYCVIVDKFKKPTTFLFICYSLQLICYLLNEAYSFPEKTDNKEKIFDLLRVKILQEFLYSLGEVP